MGVTVTPEQLAALRSTLLNTSGTTPLHERFRALFMLKAVGGDEVIQIIGDGEWWCRRVSGSKAGEPSCHDWVTPTIGSGPCRVVPCRVMCCCKPRRHSQQPWILLSTVTGSPAPISNASHPIPSHHKLTAGLADDSALLKHELAYVLGQLKSQTAVPILENVLINPDGKHCSMVRHEAAEALGAISSLDSLPVLRKYLADPAREVRETCEIAVGKIEYDHSEEGQARKPK